jgi:hypothetical protein
VICASIEDSVVGGEDFRISYINTSPLFEIPLILMWISKTTEGTCQEAARLKKK